MRILTWNCHGAFRRKFQLLDAFDADVLIIQECEDPSQSASAYRDCAGEHVWTGRLTYKGLGVFARNGRSMKRLGWPDSDASLFLPVLVDDDVQIIGVWTQAARVAAGGYSGQLARFLERNRHVFNARTILAGDFNANISLDRPNAKHSFAWCVNELEQDGFVSLHHHITGEPHGSEKRPTFYLHRDTAKPFHIDYAFVHESLIPAEGGRFSMGGTEQWIGHSDHLPLVFEV